MTTISDREVILERIRRLFALSKDGGATHGESTTAARMAARLMSQYQLAEADLHVRADGAGVVRMDVGAHDVAKAVWRGSTRRMPGWQRSIGGATARATGCRVYRSAEGLVFVGAFRDAAVAAEIQTWLVGRCDADTRAFLRSAPREMFGSGRAAASSFRNGWVAGVAASVDREIADREADQAEVRAEGAPAGSALVVVSMREISQAKSRAVSDWLSQNVGRLRKRTRNVTVRDRAAYGNGQSVGASVQVGSGANLR